MLVLGEELRHAEDTGVVVETVRLLLRREDIGGSGGDPEQVPDRILRPVDEPELG